MTTKKYDLFFFKFVHVRLSTPKAVPFKPRFKSNNYHAMLSSTIHRNVIQRLFQSRLPPLVCWCLRGQRYSRNGAINILITWINSILYVYFKAEVAVALQYTIIVNIANIYSGIFGAKSCYNNHQYQRNQKQRIFNTFANERPGFSNIKLYGPIFHSRYVYILYSSEKKLRAQRLFQW